MKYLRLKGENDQSTGVTADNLTAGKSMKLDDNFSININTALSATDIDMTETFKGIRKV